MLTEMGSTCNVVIFLIVL